MFAAAPDDNARIILRRGRRLIAFERDVASPAEQRGCIGAAPPAVSRPDGTVDVGK